MELVAGTSVLGTCDNKLKPAKIRMCDYDNVLKKTNEERCIDFTKAFNKDLFIDVFVNGSRSCPSNDGARLNVLGVYYYCVLNDYGKAIDYWLEASEQSNTESMVNIGNYYINVLGLGEQGLNWLLRAEAMGDDQAMISLGNYYWSMKKNEIKSLEYYLKAVEKLNCEAMVYVSRYYSFIHDYENANIYAKMARDRKYCFYEERNMCRGKKIILFNKPYKCDILGKCAHAFSDEPVKALIFNLLMICKKSKKALYKVIENTQIHTFVNQNLNSTIEFYLDKCIDVCKK